MNNRIFRIWSKSEQRYIQIGYNRKTSWLTFPSQVIKNNPHIINSHNRDNYEVHEFDASPAKKYDLNKNEINE